jgi:hypothetical protein
MSAHASSSEIINNNQQTKNCSINVDKHTPDNSNIAKRIGGSVDKNGRLSLNHLFSLSLSERQQHSQFHQQRVTNCQRLNKGRFTNAKQVSEKA